MFETIISLPLFRGMSEAQLMRMLEICKLRFTTSAAGKVVLQAGELNTHLTFVVSGIVRATFISTDGRLSLSQSIKGPDVIFPEYLFGLSTARPATVRSVSEVVLLHIPKNDLLKVLAHCDVAMLNYLNILSGNAQRVYREVLNGTGGDLIHRFATRICALTKPQSFDIVLEINANVASEFDTTLDAFNAAFTHLQQNHIVAGSPTRIVIKNRAALAALL